jgi:hypothetical protein
MSPSKPDTRYRIRVVTEDNAAEISIRDGLCRIVEGGHGAGTLDSMQPPGIYKVRVRAGSGVKEELVVLDRDVECAFPSIPFFSPIPLLDTTSDVSLHAQAAADQCGRVHVDAGDGSSIFIFARHLSAGDQNRPHTDPMAGLRLRTAQGDEVANLADSSARGEGVSTWAGCTVRVKPGLYRLGLDLSDGKRIEQTVVASPGWQTQIFLTQRDYGADASSSNYRANLPGGAILLGRPRGSFRADSRDARLTELARLGLTHRRSVLSEDMRSMLAGKFDAPMLGIYAAHALLLNNTPEELQLLDKVVENLRGLLGNEHPDVEALALVRGSNQNRYVFNVPPMLSRSWSLVVEASSKNPALVPAGSLAANIAARLWGEEPWLLWLEPALPRMAVPQASMAAIETTGDDEDVNLTALEAALKDVLAKLARRGSPMSDTLQALASQDPAALLEAARQVIKAQGGLEEDMDFIKEAFGPAGSGQAHPNAVTLRQFRPQVSHEMVELLVRRLGVPRSVVEEVVGQLWRRGLDRLGRSP